MQTKNKFTPSKHGFNFGNCFPGVPLPPFVANLPGISKTLNRFQDSHGLCGGMCFATYDYFIAGKEIPLDANIPQPGSPLYRYLMQRQLDTYGANWHHILKFAQWTVLSDSTLRRLTAEELQKVIAHINQGEAVILGLVYTSIVETLAIWLNHQVLAHNYAEDLGKISIKIYDPNFPCRDDVVIEVSLTAEGVVCKQICNSDKEIRVRGFFVMPYTPVEPPL